jgi:prepilin peptidase CpaA
VFIKTEWVGLWIGIIAVIATLSDLRYRKIFNWLTLPAMVVGLLISFLASGFPGLGFGIIGVLLALLAFGWMWGIKILGAGDVKLLMAFSALAGAAPLAGKGEISFVADLILLTILVGGILAALILITKGRMAPFFRKMQRFFITFTNRNLETEFPKADPSLKMPFGISISIAAVWLWIDNPLVRWGMRPWN